MTICVAVKVHDCLVFAADSAMSLDVGDETVNVYAHGNKVFNLVKGLPVRDVLRHGEHRPIVHLLARKGP